ncbi:sugar phosphate isomerase/epimerase family protein [Aquibacillus rhizosphaerae]|uniref:Sugar phosphate isomerase/epimerase family protein n=1 Tax=Aquibacillus rhizosphaerae TaxID=3051431 RepID=A0ABT7LDQ3_9BACI|nr:sugar phosphate isomerase/epimerase family protein [Aquibacillus sp. LR5S19]MDL4842676.1 sugar phosphate isomerase/epimerase family protein [Aquibacillus sp. LR5S19]
MKLYLSSTLCWAYPVNDVIKIAKLFNFDGVEVWAEHVWKYQTSIESILDATQSNDIELSLHAASWDLNLCALNEGIQKQSINEIENSLILAQKLGATNVTIHPGKRTLHNYWLEEHEQVLKSNLAYLARKACDFGVILSIEQMKHIKKEFITRPDKINHLIKALPDTVMTTFNIAHVPLDEHPEIYYEQIKRINKVHLSDATQTQYHVPLGTGLIQLEPILTLLNNTNLPVVIEGFENDRLLTHLQSNLKYLHQNKLFRKRSVESLGN